MNITDLVQGQIGQELISGLSKQIGTDNSKVSSVVSMALPFLLTQMKNNAQSGGASQLDAALQKHDGSILNNINSVIDSGNMADGLGILGHVFGDKQTKVANTIGTQTGLSTGKVMQILATVAPIVMGYLGTQKKQNNLDANGVSGLLGNILGNVQQTNGKELSVIERFLDQNGDGNISDDVMNIGSKLLGGFFNK